MCEGAVTMAAEDRWAGLGVVLVGTLIVALDSTIVAIALPQIGRALHAGQNVQWVLTANLLAVAVAMPAAGWIANRLGAKQVFLASLAVFSIASLGAALAPNLGVLIAARAAQGLCAGIINPISMTIVLDLFPPVERGRAMGVWGLVAMTAPAIGPTLGGFLVTAVSWHWLFLPNVPLGLAGAIAGRRLLVESPRRPRSPLDAVGLLLGASGLALFLLTMAQSRRWGWSEPITVICMTTSIVLLGSFAAHALRAEHPLLDLRLVRKPVFGASLVVLALVTVPQYARSVFVPLQFQDLRGYTALKVGVMLTPSAVMTALSMAVGGRLVDRMGARVPATAGCVLMLVGTAGNAFLTVTTPVAWITASLAVQGLGVGMVMIPITVVGLNALHDDALPQASTLRSLTNQAGAATAVAFLFALVNARLASATTVGGSQHAYNTPFQVSIVALVLAIAVSLRLPRRPLGG
jgi:EmrB/QacA subfamily drug resistance transporter